MKIVLVIPYRGIGDLIFHIPLIRGLNQKYNTKINILTNRVNKAKYLLKNEISHLIKLPNISLCKSATNL